MRKPIWMLAAVAGLAMAQPAYAETYEEAARCILDNGDREVKTYLAGVANKSTDTKAESPVREKVRTTISACSTKYNWQGTQSRDAATLASFMQSRDNALVALTQKGGKRDVIDAIPGLVDIFMEMSVAEDPLPASAKIIGWLTRYGWTDLDTFSASIYFPYFQEMLSVDLTKQKYGAAWN